MFDSNRQTYKSVVRGIGDRVFGKFYQKRTKLEYARYSISRHLNGRRNAVNHCKFSLRLGCLYRAETATFQQSIQSKWFVISTSDSKDVKSAFVVVAGGYFDRQQQPQQDDSFSYRLICSDFLL